MLYLMRDAYDLMLTPARVAAGATKQAFENPFSPFAYTPNHRAVVASCELFERGTRSYAKPAFGLPTSERVVWERPFCRVIAFGEPSTKPKMLIVAPMSGHYATLLRGTVAAFLDTHQVFITDWADAKLVPPSAGRFDLDDYIDYCVAMFDALGPDLHVMAVCQPSVPVLAAIARMEAEDHPLVPQSAVLIGGPIDTQRSPTAVNKLPQERSIDWFRQHCIHPVPWPHAGYGRKVYPGFLQLAGFISMNLNRHQSAHWDMFNHLVQGDGDSAAKHREFYDEYLAVMDLTAEFYLQTIETVFIDHAMARGVMRHRDEPVDLGAIRRCALMAIEGEKDDITGIGQTRAALDLATNLSAEKKVYHLQMGAGHYGIFNGSRFRAEIAPKIAAFMQQNATSLSGELPSGLADLTASSPDAMQAEPFVAGALRERSSRAEQR
ncbi:polyhydroxyalkanoate depolymerase [Methylobacterium sp. BE186]|uniref:polyhydroxyalkanoate depolymerase n=1 Tax=Methylobacterium sp. BE186 TaxID=2817715 RepID=UPI0028657337|nr:polyhydroxyalkanoate depolymerase [Methylobacterium sp. BE186]MDR7038822.1 polyhydroxyalkanoate depolymerase [Methylobacterium sp. BE186]